MSFMGKVKKIDNCYIKFKTNSGKYFIPADHILSVTFGNENNKRLKAYNNLRDIDKCMAGKSDAKLYHGKASGHVVLGVFTGPFGVVGAAVAKPTPNKSEQTIRMTQSGTLLADPTYLRCYTKKAKAKNVGNTAIGCSVWLLALLFAL